MSMKGLISAGLVLATGVTLAADRYGDWYVAVPPQVYKVMSQGERTCVDRAVKLLEGNSARAAANEWKRINNEFLTTAKEDSLAWASFFEAYCLAKAKDTFKAIDLFSEVIELYPDSEAACAATFFRGAYQGANGMRTREMDDYRAIVDNPEFNQHPLVFVARNRLGADLLGRGKLEEALQEWQTVVDMKRAINPREWDDAKNNFNVLDNIQNTAGRMVASIGKEEDKPADKLRRLRDWRNWTWQTVWNPNQLVRSYFKEHKGSAKDEQGARMEFLKKMSKDYSSFAYPYYKACGAEWEFLLVQFDVVRNLMPKDLDKMVLKVGGEVRKAPDKAAQSARALQFIGILNGMGRANDSKLFLDLILDPVKRAWTAVDIGWRMRDSKYIVENLKTLEASPDPSVSDEAKRNHARCCEELMRDYDGAIKLYEEAPAPSGTLWAIARCHRAAGRMSKAQMQLDEICSMFPNEASNAMLTKGDWYRDAGDKKNAIGCYRRILGHNDWKRTGAASQAHQRLEAFGIATGGAVVNDIH